MEIQEYLKTNGSYTDPDPDPQHCPNDQPTLSPGPWPTQVPTFLQPECVRLASEVGAVKRLPDHFNRKPVFWCLLRVADPELCAGSRVFAARSVLGRQNQNKESLFHKDLRKCLGPGSYPKRNGIRYTPHGRILDYTSHVLYFTSTCGKVQFKG